MQYCTRNPAIKKPELSDAASIIDINDNMDVIDSIICKSNFNGATDPGVEDDIDDGYSVGSNWWNVTDHRLFVAESVATGAAVWRQVYPTIDAPNHNLATAANDFLVASGAGAFAKKTLAETQAILGCRPTGWVDAPALTFSAADAPVYTVTCSGDYTYTIPVGARITLIHSGATKYFIVVKTSYSSPNTTFTLYGGTDYTLAAGAITNPYYSIAKAPVGFPLDPDKWTISLVDSTDCYQNNPVKDVYYNPGGLSINLPIGIWEVFFQVIAVSASSAGLWTEVYVGLSTSTTSFTNQSLRGRGYLGTASDGAQIFIGPIARRSVLTITSNTTYYVICKTGLPNQSVIGFNGESDASTEVHAVCAYL